MFDLDHRPARRQLQQVFGDHLERLTHRPATCRMYGFYVSATGNRWCDDIQQRSEAGMTDGVVLGNHDAVERELTRQFGVAQSLVEWFRDAL